MKALVLSQHQHLKIPDLGTVTPGNSYTSTPLIPSREKTCAGPDVWIDMCMAWTPDLGYTH